jgi:hypothetical protein
MPAKPTVGLGVIGAGRRVRIKGLWVPWPSGASQGGRILPGALVIGAAPRFGGKLKDPRAIGGLSLSGIRCWPASARHCV